MAGWDLSEAVQATIGNFWNVTRSQIYRELRTLEEHGFIVGGERGARDKRLYTLTDAGREAFQEWIAREPAQETARYPLLVTVWFSDHLSEDQFDWFLRFHRQRHAQQLEFYRALYDDFEDHSTPAARALRFGLYYQEAVMKWFDSLPNFGGVEPKALRKGEPRPSKPLKPEDLLNGTEGEPAKPAPRKKRQGA